MSTIMSQEKVMQQASLSVMKMAMDTSKSQSVELTKMMEQSVNPHVGGNIDIKL
ncbi:YjfB family protein [Crassaminicella indica]